MVKNKFIYRKFLISLIFILLIVLFVFLSVRGYADLKFHTQDYYAHTFDMIDQRITSLIHEMNIFPGGAGNDVLFLSKLSYLREVAEIINGGTENEMRGLEKDFLEFLKENSVYYQLRYINEVGREIIRVEFDGESHKAVSHSELQDKSLRYYFNETMRLNEGEVYMSPLDLHVENGKIENRGTEENPSYVPIIRFATPILDENNEENGIIIASTYADYFLDDIRRAQREGEAIFLINEQGYYLAHPDKEKEFAFMFDEKQDNFYNDYPNVAEEILFDFDTRRIETEDLIFSYRYLYPTIDSFEINEGSKKILGEHPEKRYFWILVSVSDKDRMDENTDKLKEEYIYSLLFSGLVISIILVLMFILFLDKQNIKFIGRSIQ